MKELLAKKTLTIKYVHSAPSHKLNAVGILDETLNKNTTSHLLHNWKSLEKGSVS
jgi:hypothetical protein